MTALLRFHEIASLNGDGLHPDLLRLLEERAAFHRDPGIVDLARRRGDTTVQAGPPPATKPGLFLPGNVLTMEARSNTAAVVGKSSRKA